MTCQLRLSDYYMCFEMLQCIPNMNNFYVSVKKHIKSKDIPYFNITVLLEEEIWAHSQRMEAMCGYAKNTYLQEEASGDTNLQIIWSLAFSSWMVRECLLKKKSRRKSPLCFQKVKLSCLSPRNQERALAYYSTHTPFPTQF